MPHDFVQELKDFQGRDGEGCRRWTAIPQSQCENEASTTRGLTFGTTGLALSHGLMHGKNKPRYLSGTGTSHHRPQLLAASCHLVRGWSVLRAYGVFYDVPRSVVSSISRPLTNIDSTLQPTVISSLVLLIPLLPRPRHNLRIFVLSIVGRIRPQKLCSLVTSYGTCNRVARDWFHVTMVEQRSQRATLLEEFKARLKFEWTRKVACERECESDAQCVCQRHFIHTEKLESWMNRQDSQAPPNTKATGLLDELHDKIKHHRAFGLPLDSASIFTGDNRSLIMFSMLLDQDRGDLIDIFHNAGVCDKYLGAPDHIFNATHSSLRHHLREKRYTDTEINEIIEIVGRERQAYCSRQLTLHMDASFEREKAVMPFCRRMRVNNKGGTASVFWVAVQKDLITDQKLRDALDNSLYPDPEFGPVSLLL